jgi:hypothetical protein
MRHPWYDKYLQGLQDFYGGDDETATFLTVLYPVLSILTLEEFK